MPARSYNQAACFALWVPPHEQASIQLSAAFPPTDCFSVTATLLLERLSGTILEVPGVFSIDVAGETISATIGNTKTVLDPDRFACPHNTWFSLGMSVDHGVPAFSIDGIPERLLGQTAETASAAETDIKAGTATGAESEDIPAAHQGSSLVIARGLECYVESVYLYSVALDEDALRRNQREPTGESAAAIAGCQFSSGEAVLSGMAQTLSLEGAATVVDLASVLSLGEDGVVIPFERRGALDPCRFSSNAYTITARIFSTPSEQSESVICTTGFDAERSFTFEVANGPDGRRLRVRDHGVELTASAKLPANRWVDAAVVFDGQKLALFQQGEHVGEAAGPTRPETGGASEIASRLSIGNYEEGGWGYVGSAFCGYIDRIAVFSAALGAERLASLRQTLPSRFSENIEALYDFSDGRTREHVGGGALALLGPAEVVWQRNTVNSADLGTLTFENPEVEGVYSGFKDWQLRAYLALIERYGHELLGGDLDLSAFTAQREGYTTAAAVDLVERTLSEPVTRQAFLELYRQADLQQRTEATGTEPVAPKGGGSGGSEKPDTPTEEGGEGPSSTEIIAGASAAVAASVLAGLGMIYDPKKSAPGSGSSSPFSSPQASRRGSDAGMEVRFRGGGRSPSPVPHAPAAFAAADAAAAAAAGGEAATSPWMWGGLGLLVIGGIITGIVVSTTDKKPEKEPSGSDTKTCSLSALTFATAPTDPHKSALATARTSTSGTRELDTRPGWTVGDDRSAVVYVRDALAGRSDVALSFEFTFTTTDTSITSAELTFSATGTQGPLSAIESQTTTITPNVKQTITCTARAHEARLIALGKGTQQLDWTLSVSAQSWNVASNATMSFDVHVLESTPTAPFALDPQKPETLLSADLVALCDLAWKKSGNSFAERAAHFINADADGKQRVRAAISPDGTVAEHYCEGAGAIDDDFLFDADALCRDVLAATAQPVSCGSCDAALLVATLARAQGGDLGICAFSSHEELADAVSSALIVAEGAFAGNVTCKPWTPIDHYYAPLSWSEEARRYNQWENLFVYDGFFTYGAGSPKRSLAEKTVFAPDHSPLSTGPVDGHAACYRDCIAPAGANAAPWLTPVFTWKLGPCAARANAENEISAPAQLTGISYKDNTFKADQARPAFSTYTRGRLAVPGQCTIICHSISFATMRAIIVNTLNTAVENHDTSALRTTLKSLFNAIVGSKKNLAGTDAARYTAMSDSLDTFLKSATDFIAGTAGTTAKDVGVKTTTLLTNLNDALYNLRAGSVASCEWNPSLKDCFDVREWAYVGKDGSKRYSSHKNFYDSLDALQADISSLATLPPKSPQPGFYLLNASDGERLRACKSISNIPPFAVGKNTAERDTPLLYSSNNGYFEPSNLTRALLNANAGRTKSKTKVFVRTATGAGWEQL